MAQTSVQLTSTDEQKSLSQEPQQEIRISIGSQVPGNNPCRDLLSGSRSDYIELGIPLYEASIKGDWKTAEWILDKRPQLVRSSISYTGETALHVAVSSINNKHMEDFMENLLRRMEVKDLELENMYSLTALCVAASIGNLTAVKMMVKKNKALASFVSCTGSTPLHMAVTYEKYEVAKYLYDISRMLTDDCWTPHNRGELLLACIESDMFDIAIQIVKAYPELGSSPSVLQNLAWKNDAFAETESDFIMRTINWVITIIYSKLGFSIKKSKGDALALLKLIWRYINEKTKNEIDDILRGQPDGIIGYYMPASHKEDVTPQQTQPSSVRKNYSRVIFIAAEVGNTRFLTELIRQYPDLIWELNSEKQSIFHVAVQHRQNGVYNLLYEIGSMKEMIVALRDIDHNTIFHLAGKRASSARLEDVSGVALQMQRELLWFKEVEEITPNAHRKIANKNYLTAYELFTKQHAELAVKGEKWMKDTANQCMVVAALIATMVFAAAFTVPGGYNQDDGIPIYNRKVTFMVFVIADAISLFSSTASILMFLSILTARYAERDFLESLPKKLMLGLATLFLSITTMMVAFSVSFFVLYHKDLKWVPLLVAMFASMPILLFATLQFPLLRDVYRSTYGSKYLFYSTKRVLYY